MGQPSKCFCTKSPDLLQKKILYIFGTIGLYSGNSIKVHTILGHTNNQGFFLHQIPGLDNIFVNILGSCLGQFEIRRKESGSVRYKFIQLLFLSVSYNAQFVMFWKAGEQDEENK